MWYGTQNNVAEWSFASSVSYGDAFHDVELDVVFTDPDGNERTIPAFWAGEQTWPVHYRPRRRRHVSFPHHVLRRQQLGPARAQGHH